MEPVMNTYRSDEPYGTPEFDPRRSSEIRGLLTGMVAATPKPRAARLSRATFALAATAALIFAGGTGAGTVMALDHLSGAGGSDLAATPASSATATELLGGTAVSELAGDLVPILVMDGQVGYAHQDALDAANKALAGVQVEQVDATRDVSAMVPIYRADGVTLMGYYDPVSLIP